MPRTKPIFSFFVIAFLTLSAVAAKAQIQPSSLPMETEVHAFALAPDAVRPGSPGGTLLALTLHIEKEWYAYSNILGETGKPTRLTATAADGTGLKVFYPKGKDKPDSYDPTITVAAYLDGTTLFVLVPEGLAAPFPVALSLDLLLCHPTKCVPARVDQGFGRPDLDVAALPRADAQPWWDDFTHMAAGHVQAAAATQADAPEAAIVDWQFTPTYFQPGLEVGGLLSAVLMGLLAGLILNIMPCVLPVVSLKISAFLSSCTEENPNILAKAGLHAIRRPSGLEM